MMRARAVLWLAMALAPLTVAQVARAAEPSQVAADIAANVMSPFCPGLTLHDCPSDAAVRLRDRIESWVREGDSRAQVMARLRREYGPAIAATPPASGSGLVAWLLPAAVALAGATIAWGLARRWTRRAPPSPVDDPSPEERRALAAELAELRREA